MTAIETAEGELYLAAVVDIYSRIAVGWAMGTMHNEQLITDALMMAGRRRRPDAGLLHHSDRGSEYTSHGYRALLTRYGIEVSMSRSGSSTKPGQGHSRSGHFVGPIPSRTDEDHLCFTHGWVTS